MSDPIVHPGADVSAGAWLEPDVVVWNGAVVREEARIGRGCTLGRGAYIDRAVTIGPNCKVQDAARIYGPAVLAAGVFVGPGAILANDRYPRAINPDGSKKAASEWHAQGVTVGEGAAVGAAAVVIAGVSLGRWSLVAASAVVTKDVLDFALVAGNPARRRGWVGRHGTPLLEQGAGRWVCQASGSAYVEADGVLVELGQA
jgi:acetyltransferase-like isoleucine patch superfamily enzyme